MSAAIEGMQLHGEPVVEGMNYHRSCQGGVAAVVCSGYVRAVCGVALGMLLLW